MQPDPALLMDDCTHTDLDNNHTTSSTSRPVSESRAWARLAEQQLADELCAFAQASAAIEPKPTSVSQMPLALAGGVGETLDDCYHYYCYYYHEVLLQASIFDPLRCAVL